MAQIRYITNFQDVNDGGEGSIAIFPPDYNYSQPAVEATYLDPRTIQIKNINILGNDSKVRVGLCSPITAQISVDLRVNNDKQFAKSILNPLRDIEGSEGGSDSIISMLRTSKIHPQQAPLQQPMIFHITKSAPVASKKPGTAILDYIFVYTAFNAESLKLNQPLIIDCELQNVLSYVLKSLPFKTCWWVINSIGTTDTHPNDNYEFPCYFNYINTLQSSSMDGEGKGRNNVKGAIISVPGTMNDEGFKDNKGHDVRGISELDSYRFIKLKQIFDTLSSQFIQVFQNKICGDNYSITLPSLLTKYYKQSYSNSYPTESDVLTFDDLWIIIGAKNDLTRLYSYLDEDVAPDDIFTKLDYTSICDFLHDLYLTDGSFVYYTGYGTILRQTEPYEVSTNLTPDPNLIEISQQYIKNGFNNIRTNNIEFGEDDVQFKQTSSNIVGTGENVNNAIIFQNMPIIRHWSFITDIGL